MDGDLKRLFKDQGSPFRSKENVRDLTPCYHLTEASWMIEMAQGDDLVWDTLGAANRIELLPAPISLEVPAITTVASGQSEQCKK